MADDREREPAGGDEAETGREHDPEEHLKRVRERLQLATDGADHTVKSQLESITAGVFEEQDGHLTQSEPGPKDDRIAEIAAKLDGLAAEASGETADHVLVARDRCLDYLEESGP
ncbi:DUF7553 family protein [Halobiforma nitratireducens]|uniref:Uncharacterized protein n=1 Tax=Halobiforma nitratireducens JCM 10879 TaxID=1227454 RepID=M0M7N4_9EURY|nr:hypothetical protein [Halobiforma nitratireducens]EMA41832.1 hypothetical protein C446_05935 [Halobiforma nitratireducens JCM 10879]